MNNKKKKIIISIILTTLLICSAVIITATVLFKSSVKTQGDLTANDVDKVVDVSDTSSNNLVVDTSVQTLNFNKAGDSNELTISVKNNTKSVIQYQYEFSFDSDTILRTESFASAILVYFNGDFIDTLGNLCSNDENKVKSGYINFKGFVNAAQSSDSTTYTASSETDTLKFVLHASADGSIFDNDSTNLSFKLKTYAKTADYADYIYINNESDFIKAVDDINTGLLSESVNLVLFNDISITSSNLTINYPFELDLNGHYLNGKKKIYLKQSGKVVIKSLRKLSVTSISDNLNDNFSIILNNSDGILEIKDFYNASGTNLANDYTDYVSLTSYSNDKAKTLISAYIKNKVKYGIELGDSINILNGLSIYDTEKSNIKTSSNLNFKSGNNTLSVKDTTITTTLEEYITFNGETILVKVYGYKDEATLNSLFLENGELYYLSKLAETDSLGNIQTTDSADLFLPTSIKSKNISIEWKTNNKEYLSDNGIIQSNVNNGTKVSITGYFTINNKVLTKTISIKISSQNHDTIFQYFIAQLSPITIEHVYSSGRELYSYYYLPIVANSTSNKYHYTNEYTTPYNEDSTSTEVGYSWLGFNDVAFESLTYSQIPAYNFISIDQAAIDTKHNNDSGVAVYLASATFETFAQINLVGKFANDEEEYSGKVNIIINPGYDTSLNELVFEKTEQDLAAVNVLQNILDTRKENNMLNEKGDFTLDGTYNTYYIQYVIPESSKDAISSIVGYSDEECTKEVASISGTYTYSESSETDWKNMFTLDQMKQIVKYKVCLNPEGFSLNDSSFAINVVLVMPTSDNVLHTAARIQYFTCPGVIKCDSQGFSNMSVFNSVKYQVWSQLKQKTQESYNGDVLSGDYTLSTDTDSFTTENNVVTNHTGAYILRHDAYLCNSLIFDTSEKVTSTDNHIIYGLAKLIDWATSDSTDTIASRYEGDSSFDTTSTFYTTYKTSQSNGTSYLDGTEQNVIKAYYKEFIKTDLTDTEWTTILNNISYTITDSDGNPKYIIYDYAGLTSSVQAYWNDTSNYGTNYDYGLTSTASTMIGKWNDGLICWAYNTKYVGERAGSAACYGTYDWTGLVDSDYSSWSSSKTSGYSSSKYQTNSKYVYDNTSYITVYELEVLMAFMLNTKSNWSNSTSATNTSAKQEVQRIRDTYFVIPRYFNSDGIGSLISQAYTDLGKSLSGTTSTGFSAELSSFTVAGNGYTTPHVTLLDSSTNGLNYFPELTTLYIHGDYDYKLRAFHQDSTLTSMFNRIIGNNTKLENLAIEYCSDSNMTLELDNIYKLENLKIVSLKHNQAISNVGALLKLDLEHLSYVNIADVNVLNKYSEFTLQAINLKSKVSHSVYYSKDGFDGETIYRTALNSDAEGLIYLEEFYTLLAENAQLTQYVYDDSLNQVQVQWAIEEGNGLTYIDSSKTSAIDTIDYPYTNYYFVTSDFTYNNFTFEANKLYKISSNDSGTTIIFSKVLDPNGDEITLLSSEPSDTLSDDEKNAAISGIEKTNITEQGEYSLTQTGNFNSISISSNTSETPTDNEKSIYSSTSETKQCVFYDSDGNKLNQYSKCFSFGYLSSNLSRTMTYEKTDYTLTNAVSTSVTKYYYTSESGYFNVYKKIYSIRIADKLEYTTYTREDTEQFKCWYVASSRSKSGSWWSSSYTYTFVNLLGTFPTIRYIEFNGTKYDIYDTSYGYSKTEGTSTSTSQTQENINVITPNTSVLCSAMDASTYLSSAISNINKTVSITNAATYYNDGTSTSISSGVNTITIGTDGFKYEAASSSTALLNAKYMDDLLATANTHLSDSYFGLYYHKYYAYGGGTATYNGFTYTQYNIYYLDIGSDSKFYWAQDSNTNARTYTTLTGTYASIDSVMNGLESSDLGKVYYYIGSANSDWRTGTNVWFQVVYNSKDNVYEFTRFGTIDSEYLVFNSSGTLSTRTNGLNNDGLKSICNIVEYMDTYTFSSGASSTTFDKATGGTFTAVIKATITVNGTKYERLFVMDVIG